MLEATAFIDSNFLSMWAAAVGKLGRLRATGVVLTTFAKETDVTVLDNWLY
jgi:hypothetical protein